MTHTLGRVIARGNRIGPDSGAAATSPGVWAFSFTADPAVLGGQPRFAFLHFTGAAFPPGSWLEVPLGYDTDRFDATSGGSFWTRPFNPATGAATIRFHGAAGGVTLAEYGSGEPTITGTPGTSVGSQTNPDVFLQTNPFQEPVYETRLECGVFDWLQAASATTPAEIAASKATGIIVSAHRHSASELAVSSCSGTLIAPDLFMTARHCATEGDGLDILSASVSFDYQTTLTGSRPAGYAPSFHKVRRVVRAGAAPQTETILTDWLVLQIDTPLGGLGIAPRPLRSAAPMAGEAIVAIHHPHGAVKKLQRGVLTSGNVASVHGFDYAGGSSGSALFDTSGSVIGAALSRGVPGPCDVAYAPARSVLDALATPPPPVKPFDVVMVMDRSGSMSSTSYGIGWTKMHHAAEAGAMFVSLVRQLAGDRLGLVSFSTSATNPPDVGLGVVDLSKKTQLYAVLGSLTPSGSTSIGDGLAIARNALSGTSNQPSILLLTDGLQNTQPWIDAVAPSLGNTMVSVIGFGNEWDLDGPRLTRLAREHGGIYVRALDSLSLKKFFSLTFGNIFQSGLLKDPTGTMAAGDDVLKAFDADVCDEDQVTVVVGWDDPIGALIPSLIAPDGTTVDESTPGCEAGRGTTWSHLRVPLPQAGNRGGSWTVVLSRDRQRGKESVRLEYTVSVVASGGPKLTPIPPATVIRVGDPLPILVGLHHPDGTAPHAEIEVHVTRPDGSLGDLVASHGLVGPTSGSDPTDSWHATLAQIASSNGGRLPIGEVEDVVKLFDDGAHGDGAMERDGIFGETLDGFTKVEGTYSFHAFARYGDTCPATREAVWSVYVHASVDPDNTEIEVKPGRGKDGRRRARLVLRPRDAHGGLLGPGRIGPEHVTGALGTTIRSVVDRGDGSYVAEAEWDPRTTKAPSVLLQLTDAPPVVVSAAGRGSRKTVS